MNKYELQLKNEKSKSYDRITIFILLINFSLFVLSAIRPADKTIKISCLLASLVLTGLLVSQFSRGKTNNNRNYIYNYTGLLVAAATWIIVGNWWAGIVNLLLFILYRVSKRRLKAEFKEANIKYTSFPARSIEWNQLNNAILKDGILTIDFRNNKILQAEIEDTGNHINEKEFNDFCRQQLKEKSKA